MKDIDFIITEIENSINVKRLLLEDVKILEQIKQISSLITKIYLNGGKTLIAGNGGSAADAQHISAEFISKFNFDRPGLPSIALSTNTSVITAVSNDYGYEKVFSRQIEAFATENDLFIGITTSGKSKNIIEALKESKKRNLKTVVLAGENTKEVIEFCDFCISIPSSCTPRIQEAHILIGHIICAFVEKKLFEDKYN